MNTALYMHFSGEKDAHLYSEKYKHLAVSYCEEHGENLVIILEGNGINNDKSQEAIQQLIQEGFVGKVLFPNLLMIASDPQIAEKLVEKLSDFKIKIRFLDCMERQPKEILRTMEVVC